MRKVVESIVTFTVAFFLSTAAFGQSNGTVRGVVKDPSGGVLPGASVVLVNGASQQRFETTTTGPGTYIVAFLPPGEYSLTIDLVGFKRFVRQRVRVDVAGVVVVDATLEIGTVAESVTVSGEAPQLQLATSSLGSVVENKTLMGVPLSSRNFTQILSLSPGVTSDVPDAGAMGRNSVNLSANGARPWDNGLVMNGLSADNPMSQGFDDTQDKTGIPIPAPDAIEEFKVQAGLNDAEVGKQGGAVVSIVTKSGGSTFKGSAYDFFRNDKMNANDFFRIRSGVPKPELRQNQYGGSVGGPVIKSKAFFFVSYQGTQQQNGVSSAATRATFLPLLGDRSAAGLGAIYGGQSGVFGGVAVAPDGSNINPVAINILNAKLPNGQYVIPAPQIVLPNGTGFSTLSDPAQFHENQLVANGDVTLSNKQRLAVKTFYASLPSTLPFSLSSNLFGFGETDYKTNVNIALSHTYTINSTTLNELRVGFNRSNMNQVPIEPLTAAQVGMQPAVLDKPGMTQIVINGSFTIGPDTNNDQQVLINTLEIADTMSKVIGRHQLRIGGTVSPTRVLRHEVYVKRGTLFFLSIPDFLLGMSGQQNGSPFSNINSSLAGSGREYNHPAFNNFALFTQDDFRVNDRLTLNLGVRYQYNGMQYTTDGLEANFDQSLTLPGGPPPQGTLAGIVLPANVPSSVSIPPGVTKLDRNSPVQPNWHGFAPRLGFAWRPVDRFQNVVLRGGYGLFWSSIAGTVGEQMFVDPPFYATIAGGGALFPNATLQNPFPGVPQLSAFPLYTPYTLGSNLSVYPSDPTMKQPYTQVYSVNVQTELKSLLFQVGYVGSRTTNLVSFANVNQALDATPQHPVNGQTTDTLENLAQRAPILGFAPNAYYALATSYNGHPFFGHYNSFQLSVNKRYGNGLSFSGAYTWSRCIDDISASPNGRNQPIGGTTGDYYNPPVGPCDYDRTHRFVTSYVWELPTAHNATGMVAGLVNGWSISGVGTLQSGLPYSIIDSTGGTIYGGGQGSYAQLLPGQNPAAAQLTGATQDRLNNYFNTSVFTNPPAVGDGTGFGNAPRNFLRGPGQFNVDMALIKLFRAGGEKQFEFRAEMFNVFNRANFGLPGNDRASPSTFGVISTTVVAPRIMQLGLRFRF